MWLNNWASVARNDKAHLILPDFGSAKFFPSVDLVGLKPMNVVIKEDRVTQRFVFSNSEVCRFPTREADFNAADINSVCFMEMGLKLGSF